MTQPAHVEQAPELVVQKGAWKLSIPAMAVVAAISAVGARMLPTQTPTDVNLNELRAAEQLREMRDERFRQEVRDELRALRETSERQADEIRNRIATVEARLSRDQTGH